LFHACGRMCKALCGSGSCGCSGEVYWSEWHNDPPCCCDPCNRCGQWTGPSAGCGCGGCGGCGSGNCGCNGGYSGPDAGSYGGGEYYSSNRPSRPNGVNSYAANRPQRKSVNTSMARTSTGYSPKVARNTSNPYTRARLARETQPILTQPPQSRR
jgi:hypothetical protein